MSPATSKSIIHVNLHRLVEKLAEWRENNDDLRAMLRHAAEAYLKHCLDQNYLDDFSIICDEFNNDVNTADHGILHLDYTIAWADGIESRRVTIC